ncbi:MAG: protein translocase subunit SecF [Clostridia bacterium]|nr:protein translocase subunit SecF [Clostridia bacterium]
MLKKEFQLVQKVKLYLIISLVVILLGAGFMIFRAVSGNNFLNLGIDFTGGTVLTVETGSEMNASNKQAVENTIIDFLKAEGVTDFAPVQSSDIGTTNANMIIKFVAPSIEDMKAKHPEIADSFIEDTDVLEYLRAVIMGSYGSEGDRLFEAVSAHFSAEYAEDDFVRNVESVSASASETLVLYTFVAVIVAAVLILVYIAIRFRSFSSGLAAVFGLLHDVLVMVAIVAIINLQINSTFIAAVITIIGYSINNTIIVFDRIREKRRADSALAPTPLVNSAVRDTVTRTINTTITTLLPLVALAFLGGASITEFIIPIIIGLFAGVWSSVFISPELWAVYMEHSIKKKGDKSEYMKQIKLREKAAKKAKPAAEEA